MAPAYTEYSPLEYRDEERPGRNSDPVSQTRTKPTWMLRTILTLSLVLNAGLVLYQLSPRASVSDTQVLYSPAQDVLRYRNVVFDSSFGAMKTLYQGPPSEVNNALWSELYNFGINRISAEEARPMVNKTLPIPGDEDHYIISLSVFHQLHCLNQVRKGLYGEVDWTDEDDHTGITHLDHCVDIIRQNLMCNADITPLTWTRDSHDGLAKEVAEVVHNCRDFDAIRDWAKARPLRVMFDASKVVDDDPLGWGGYQMSP